MLAVRPSRLVDCVGGWVVCALGAGAWSRTREAVLGGLDSAGAWMGCLEMMKGTVELTVEALEEYLLEALVPSLNDA